MTHTARGLILLYQWAAGLCDASTGAMLVAAPAWTFRLMGLHILPQPAAFIQFIGAFVLGVGLSYLVAALSWQQHEWRGQWTATAVIRSAVAILLAWQIASGAMEPGWLAVAFTDAILATIQWIGLSRQWLRVADPS
jgi:hypothetical protein